MSSTILATGVKLFVPLFVIFSLFLLLRGHNAPGGGFVGGLVFAIAFSLHTLSAGVTKTKQKYKIQPVKMIAFGLLIATISATLPVFVGQPFFTGLWYEAISLPVLGKPGTPILFDIGVYLTVAGTILALIFTLWEAE
ncbi:Na+/H+ antiporter subunit B [Ostreibacterium oceani]|uniref:Na+/H+ antiporter subunit B n=1 Tax=Ostreibacterium oceani TaxID=2654998 RepID=A0A6N7EY70_9GAMM|nr:Na+/H+ antiporter subunit B [Ostreibacterium oceani]MPV86515.1 Na+/H+ antiporter subunit B [Ostreibacterium oceani]